MNIEATLCDNCENKDRYDEFIHIIPQTVYKKQKLDKDDITECDTVSWLKAEMRIRLDEELTRVILVGDDNIKEEHTKPIWKDDSE